MKRPASNEYAPPYAGYVAAVPDGNILDMLREQAGELAAIAARVPQDRETFAYADGKWSVREVFGHMCDGERIFAYRALRIGRGDTTPLPGFEEKSYVENSRFGARPLADLVDELVLVRRSNLLLFGSFDDVAWERTGTASDYPISVRALVWIMAGHVRHHLNVLRDRYGIA